MKPSLVDTITVDFETVMGVGYSLRKMSTRAYVEDPRFQILGVGIAVGAEPITFYWDGAAREQDNLYAALEVLQRERAKGRVLVAHNVHFEAMVLHAEFGLVFEQMFDTAAYARFLGIGASLASTARWMGFEKKEAPPFTSATLDDPERLAQMARYCMTDVAICRAALQRALSDPSFSNAEFDLVNHTAHLNLRGVRVGRDEVARFLAALRTRRDEELGAFTRVFAFDTTDIRRGKKVMAFLRERYGVVITSLDRRKDEHARVMASGGPAADFLLRRARLDALSKAITKGIAYEGVADGGVHGVVRYYGAHTGRFSAGGRDAEGLNLHGLGKASVLLGLPELALERRVVVPEPGTMFCAGDLSTIEARVVAWLAGEHDLLERFRAADDIYCWFAGLIFPGLDIGKSGPNAHLRKLGKEAVLGLGFGMGIETFIRQVRAKQIPCTDGDIKRAFETYRSSFTHIGDVRRTLMRAFERAARGWSSEETRWRIDCTETAGASAPTVAVELPTSRSLFYRSVRVEKEATPWGMRDSVWFAAHFGSESKGAPAAKRHKVRRFPDGVVRSRLTPSVLVENIVQGIARDVMAHQVLELERRGSRVAWHVHDEIVVACEACACLGTCDPTCTWSKAGAVLLDVMGSVPNSLPRLADLPVAAELNASVRRTYGG